MRRNDVVKIMAKAMHEWGYTWPYEELSDSARSDLETQADAALTALECHDLLAFDLK
jgi:hypothetical protein